MPYCSNTYSALNALAGHFNSFGATAPIPKNKRIIDYAGEKITNKESLKREIRYLKK